MMNNWKGKLSFTVAGVLLMTTALGGCSTTKKQTQNSQNTQESQTTATEAAKETENTEQKEEPIKLTFWNTYGDTEDDTFKNVVLPMWNEKHPNITIEDVRQDSSNYNQMIITGFGTGEVPDVARIDIVNTASYAAQGGLTALDQYSDFAEYSKSFLAGPLATNFYDGHYYGMPLDTNCKAAVVNQNKLKEIGLDAAPATMEEFIKAVQGYGSPLLSVSGVGDWDLYPYFWLFGGTLTNEDNTKATDYLNSDASVQAVNTMLDLHKRGILTIRDVDGTADAWDGISSGDFAMFFEGPWYFGSYEDSAANGIVPALIPSYNGKTTSVVGGENIVVFSTSKQQEAAYQFSQFMTSEEVQLAMLQVGQLPVINSLVDNDTVKNNPVWSVYMQQMETAQARTPSPSHEEIGTIWSDTMTNIFTTGADVKEALTSAAASIDELLNK